MENNVHLLAVDPAKTKPTIGASFINGKFNCFFPFKHKLIIVGKENPIEIIKDMRNIAVVELPHINPKHSIKTQIALAVAIGEISLWIRQCGYEVVHVHSWGNQKDCWIQAFFGQRLNRATILRVSKQVCRADRIAVKNDDYSMSYCLGKWAIRNNIAVEVDK